MKTTATIDSPIGKLTLTADDTGLTGLEFLDSEDIISDPIPENLKAAVTQLQEYFDKKRAEFELTLAPSGTQFQFMVWEELRKIPFGSTISYSELAGRLGNPKVIRAAASANGKNPLPIIIPCHRVVGSDGSLTGFSGGLDRKKWLLDHESPSRQQRLF